MRQLVDQYRARMAAALAAPPAGDGHMPVGVFSISATLSLLAKALHDPDVHVDAVLAYSPQPNANQMEGFVREYLECARPADALPWLERDWGYMQDSRQRLLADALGKLGRHAESAALLQGVFEKTLSIYDLRSWMEVLPPEQQSQAASRSRELALRHPEPVAAALVLVEIGGHVLAESVMLASHARIDGQNYGSLVPLATALEANGCGAGASAVYRALLDAILKRAYARAYSHAFRYWQRLGIIAASGTDLGALGTHQDYVAGIRRQHGRKASFWAYVNGTREAQASTEIDEDDGV